MGKIYRFPFPKYRSLIDPSDRSGTGIFGIAMAAFSALLSSYGIELAIVMVWFIGGLFVIGLFWENYPKTTRLLTTAVSLLGIIVVVWSLVHTLFLDSRSEFLEPNRSMLALLRILGSAFFGFLFFAEVIRGARSSAHVEDSTD